MQNASAELINGNFRYTEAYYNGEYTLLNGKVTAIGGTYSEDVTLFCQEGYKAEFDAQNIYWVIVPGGYEAAIGETKYSTLEAALAAAVDGDTVVLLSDAIVDTKVNVTDGVSIMLDGYTVYWREEDSTFGNVTIYNGNAELGGRIVVGDDDAYISNGFFQIGEGKTLTLDDVGVVSSDNGFSAFTVFFLNQNAELVVDGSWIMIENYLGDPDIAGSIVYANDASAKLTVNESEIYGTDIPRGVVNTTATLTNSYVSFTGGEHGFNRTALTLVGSSVDVTDGSGRGITAQAGDLNMDADSYIYIENMGEAGIQLRDRNLDLEGEICADLNAESGDNVITGTGYLDGEITVNEGATLTIYGGTYTMDPTEWVAENYEAVDNGDGTWTVEQSGVAQNVETRKIYSDVSDALKDAESGDTVALLKNAEDDLVLVYAGTTLDLAGYTLTVDNLVGFNTSNVADNSTDMTGLLKVAAGCAEK